MLLIRLPHTSVKTIVPILHMALIALLYILGFNLIYFFFFFVVLTYIILFPKKLLNPKNIVFAYYFVWHCLAPAFANRYKYINLEFGEHRVNTAFLMCFVTYAVSMFALELFLGDLDTGKRIVVPIKRISPKAKREEKKKRKNSQLVFGLLPLAIVSILFVVGLYVYIRRTGGIAAWISSANDAFFNRGGAGLFYILFTHTLLLLLYFEGQRAETGLWSYFRRILYIALLAVSYTVIGSRSTTFMMILVLFADRVIKLDTLDRKSLLIIFSGLTVFVVGMIVRLGDLMRISLSVSVNQILNYFDTFENLLILLRDFSPDIGKTFFLPLNWPLVKMGVTAFSPFYDMSVWLTTEYYPESWLNGGTTQWPIEADMYMSFMFWGGIPVLILYFGIIAYIYKKAQDKGIWQFIYIIEGFYILSHLRGGFLIYWYYWLIPLYIWLVMRYGRKNKL